LREIEVLAGEQLGATDHTDGKENLNGLSQKRRGLRQAEPSLEGPVGWKTGNRPLNNQFPVNPSVAFQNAGRCLWARRAPAHASWSRAATWVKSVAGRWPHFYSWRSVLGFCRKLFL